MPQYTIRNIPDALDQELRERARRRGTSLNEAAIDALRRGLGITENVVEYGDLDDLIGTWKKDEAFEQALADQDTIDLDI
ncbi:MAG: hypothetical protein KAU31_02965 [Spirochaetaceae bacterium]|nr:hypothetical protein [Spirochaetaceae bacterium]